MSLFCEKGDVCFKIRYYILTPLTHDPDWSCWYEFLRTRQQRGDLPRADHLARRQHHTSEVGLNQLQSTFKGTCLTFRRAPMIDNLRRARRFTSTFLPYATNEAMTCWSMKHSEREILSRRVTKPSAGTCSQPFNFAWQPSHLL